MTTENTVFKLPKDNELPPVMRELVANAPEKFKMATFIATVAPLGCLATRLRFYYPLTKVPWLVFFKPSFVLSNQVVNRLFAM